MPQGLRSNQGFKRNATPNPATRGPRTRAAGREQQVARDRYLTGLAKRERQAWQRVDTLIGTKRLRNYDAAVRILLDLRDVSGRKTAPANFAQRISERREAHATKSNLLPRLKRARR
jgi:hypothetical protein